MHCASRNLPFLRSPAALAVLACLSVSAAAENLVPGNFNPRTDGGGFYWDIEQRGMVSDGNNDCFDGGLILTVNGAEFISQQPQMTQDGRELVLSTALGSVTVTRRTRVDPAVAGIRFVDMFRNTSGSAVSVTANLRSHLGGQCQMTISDAGAQNPTTLGKTEGGLIAVQHPGTSRPSVMWLLADPRSRVKPSIAVNQNYEYNFTYTLNIPPGRTMSVMHTCVMMQMGGTAPDAARLAALIKPYRSRDWLKDLPGEVRRTLVNAGRGSAGGGGDAPELLAHLERLGIARGDADVLASGEETRLRGKATCAKLSIETHYGVAEIPFADVAALVGSKHLGGGGGEIYLRDGQVLRGKIAAEKLRFTLNSGLALDLKIESLDRLVTEALPTDGKADAGVAAIVDTFDGDRLALVRGTSATFVAQTPWGPREVKLDELRWLRLPGDDRPGHLVGLNDGSRFFAYLAGEPLNLEMRLFGGQQFLPTEIRAIQSTEIRREGDSDEIDPGQPHVILAGGTTLAGRIDAAEIHFLTSGTVVPVPPEQLRSMRNQSSDEDGLLAEGTAFLAEIWGGGTLEGSLQETVLPIRLADRVIQVPVRDIVDVVVPTPSVPESLRDTIAALIRDLGNDDWETRETASRELADLGFLSHTQLSEADKQATDPEVRRRVRVLLESLKE